MFSHPELWCHHSQCLGAHLRCSSRSYPTASKSYKKTHLLLTTLSSHPSPTLQLDSNKRCGSRLHCHLFFLQLFFLPTPRWLFVCHWLRTLHLEHTYTNLVLRVSSEMRYHWMNSSIVRSKLGDTIDVLLLRQTE